MNVFELFAKIDLDTSGYDKGLSQSKAALSKFGGAVSKIAKVGTAAFGAMATGTAAITKKAIDAYGEYEQQVGGVETLFGESAMQVLKNSQKAFETAGMSMNQYMETSIQGAAALVNSLGGDQSKAAKLMDMSIRDMSD